MTNYVINWESWLTFTFVTSLILTIADGLRGLAIALAISGLLFIVAIITAYFDDKRMK